MLCRFDNVVQRAIAISSPQHGAKRLCAKSLFVTLRYARAVFDLIDTTSNLTLPLEIGGSLHVFETHKDHLYLGVLCLFTSSFGFAPLLRRKSSVTPHLGAVCAYCALTVSSAVTKQNINVTPTLVRAVVSHFFHRSLASCTRRSTSGC